MTNTRVFGILLLMVLVGLGLCGLRGETARCARRIQLVRQQQQALRQQSWARQMEIARQCSVESIRWRIEQSALPLGPAPAAPSIRADSRLASTHRR